MITVDEEALICDLAETYHIFYYKSLPCRIVATFACGLRENSRIKMKMSGMNATIEQTMLAAIVDSTRLNVWLQSADGIKGRNRPESIADIITGRTETKSITAYTSPEEFDRDWKKYTGGGE